MEAHKVEASVQELWEPIYKCVLKDYMNTLFLNMELECMFILNPKWDIWLLTCIKLKLSCRGFPFKKALKYVTDNNKNDFKKPIGFCKNPEWFIRNISSWHQWDYWIATGLRKTEKR